MNYQEKCRWLADFYREAAETGREIQFYNQLVWEKAICGPTLQDGPRTHRLKPEPPKAWVVWDAENPLSVAKSQAAAREIASQFNGTIQEITRPDK
jgi:hypothetical protein